MFKLSEIIKKSDAEKLEQLKKNLKKQQSPREAILEVPFNVIGENTKMW